MHSRMRIFLCKILQRRIYDLFSNKQSLLICFGFFCMIFIALLHVLEILFVWNQQSVNNVNFHISEIEVHDKGRSLCSNFPVDVVYTWVNGSDPLLLEELSKIKTNIQLSLSQSDCQQKSCQPDSDCIETPIVFIRPVLENPHKLFNNITKFEMLKDKGSLIYFSSISTAREQTLRCFLSYNSITYSLTRTHIMIEKEVNVIESHERNDVSVSVSSIFLLNNIPDNTSSNSQLLRYLSPFVRKQVNIINIYDNRKIALLTIKNSFVNLSQVLQALKIHWNKYNQIFNQSIKIRHQIDLMFSKEKFFSRTDRIDDMTENRFADNQELRYSLRSIEKNAQWIRNIYIVTNGQIPYWLNLENPRIKIITHEDIFPNKSHLPTFSSPAIETHLHRIPNLSKKFLYLNDDILFGKRVYPEDFFTESKGFKVYLSWPVPNCADGCPMNWLKDGYCDQACNSSECLWDGGDCDSDKIDNNNEKHNDFRSIANPRYRFNSRNSDVSQPKTDKQYCSGTCVDSWLSDKFCDQVCNNKQCGYDLGDCGIHNFNQLNGLEFSLKQTHYYFPANVSTIYFNFTKFYLTSNIEINEMSYENNSYVRASALNLNHKVLTFIFYEEIEKTNISIILKGLKNSSELIIRFHAVVNSDQKLNTDEEKFNFVDSIDSEENNLTEPYFHITNNTENSISSKTIWKYDNIYPKVKPMNESEFNISLDCQFNVDELPDELKIKFEGLEQKLKNGILTEKGLKNFRLRLIKLYINQLCKYETTIKRYDKSMSPFDWEKQSTFSDIEKSISSVQSKNMLNNRVLTRHLMDSYADSLRHVNQLYNTVFGIEMRKVPAHMAHFIDIDIMTKLQTRFAHHFDITSSHQIRSSDDMQFAFAYNYYLMSESNKINLSQIFDSFDVDSSGSWSSLEMRSVLININDLPLKEAVIEEFYEQIILCCNTSNLCDRHILEVNITDYYYRGINEKLSLEIPKSLVLNCENVTNKLTKRYDSVKANKFEIIGEEEVSFKMIRSNATILAKELDELNKQPKKFMCLNDNIEHKEKIDVKLVKQMLQQFYESMFPNRSQFELPINQINAFAYIQHYHNLTVKSSDKQIFFTFNTLFIWILCMTLVLFMWIIMKKINFKSKKNILYAQYWEKGKINSKA